MAAIPRDRSPDSTLALLRDGYRFISKRCDRYGSDLFETRLMLRPVVCMRGREAARLLYEPDRFTRRGAVPGTTLKLLQDEGSVQQLDGPAHRRRKALFLSLMTPEATARLAELAAAEWRARLPPWAAMPEVVLHDEAQAILFRAACRWAGAPLAQDEAAARTRAFAAMVDGAGSVGPRNWRGLLLRPRQERWAAALVGDVRAGRLHPPAGGALAVFAAARELDEATAAVELLNVLRPIVAVAWFVTFAALALHRHAEERRALEEDGDDARLERFVQEVRRLSPFFPFVGGRVLAPFEWAGRRFAAGDWALLDLYGTNRDPRLWPEPEAFRSDRFRNWSGDPNSLVPQGAGEQATGHRCPGERPTIELMKMAVRLLTKEMRYGAPPQDLTVDLSRIPAIPRSRFVIAGVRPR